MKKNKYLTYVLFGVPLLIGTYFVIKSMKKKPTDETMPEEEKKNPVKDVVNIVKDIVTTYTPTTTLPLKKGMSSGYVRAVQRVLGLTQDAKFGSKTESAVKSFQKKNNLTADGIVGAKTWRALFFADFPNEDTRPVYNTNPNIPTYITNPSSTQPKPIDLSKPFGY